MTIAMTYPLITTALAALILDKAITAGVVMGALLTPAGILLIVMGRPRRPEPRPERYWVGVAAAGLASLVASATIPRIPQGRRG
jgi:drug/metabolite transporter (DMT)-like permease